MKYLCDSCGRLVDARLFRVDAGALVLNCDTCGQESRTSPAPARPPPEEPPAPRPQLASTPAGSNVVELRAPTRDGSERARALATQGPFAVPDGHCPKCIAPRTGGSACSNCGADFSLVTADGLMPESWLQEGWVKVLNNWADTGAHDALSLLAFEKGELAALGRLYRLFLAHVPDDPLARRGREEILRRASVPALVAAPPQKKGEPAWKVALTIVSGLGALFALYLLIRALLESQG